MPPGWVHNRVRKKMAPATLALAGIAGAGFLISPIAFAAGAVVGVPLGAIVDPDLDQISITAAEGRMMRTIGPLALPWLAFWGLYAAFPLFKHRSFWTHYPVVSTFIRIVFFAALSLWGWMQWQKTWPPVWLWFFWAGVWFELSIQDLIHTTADEACSIYKYRKSQHR